MDGSQWFCCYWVFFLDFCWYVKVSTLVLIFIMVSFDLDPGVVTLFILIYNKFLNCSDRVYIVSRVVFWYETFWWVLNLYLSFRTSHFLFVVGGYVFMISIPYGKFILYQVVFILYVLISMNFFILLQGVWVFHTKFTFLICRWGCFIEVHY